MTYRFDAPVMLIGGGPVGRLRALEAAQVTGPVVAADSGADTAARFGMPLSALIGDLDSVSAKCRQQNREKVTLDTDQDSTDFEKCLKHVSAPLMVGVGFLGGQIDHELASLNALSKHTAAPVILMGEYDLVFRCPREISLDLPLKTRVSLFPMGPVTGLYSTGLRWPVNALEFAPSGKIGTSNATNAPQQTIRATGDLLVIIPVDHLEIIADSLLKQPRMRPSM